MTLLIDAVLLLWLAAVAGCGWLWLACCCAAVLWKARVLAGLAWLAGLVVLVGWLGGWLAGGCVGDWVMGVCLVGGGMSCVGWL